MLPNGETKQASSFRRKANTTIIPGSTIVVPRDAAPFEWLFLASTVAPILSGVALAAASLSAISD